MSSVNYTTRTEGETKIDTIIWTIPNIFNLGEMKKRKAFRTQTSIGQNVDEIDRRFHLKLMFLGVENDVMELHYMSAVPVFLKVILIICLKRFEERSIMIQEYHTVEAKKWQYLSLLYKKELVGDGGRDPQLLSDGSLRLKVQFFVSNNVMVEPSNLPEMQLAFDLENVLNNGLLSDYTIKSVEGIEYKVHKLMLACRSAVLRAHFEHNTRECYTHVIETPFEADVLSEVLRFIYSGKVPMINSMPDKLLAAADYYELGLLKTLCEKALYKKLDMNNAMETLEVADLHGATNLKLSILEFIKDGREIQITKTEGWAKAKSVKVLKTLYEYMVIDQKESNIT